MYIFFFFFSLKIVVLEEFVADMFSDSPVRLVGRGQQSNTNIIMDSEIEKIDYCFFFFFKFHTQNDKRGYRQFFWFAF